MAQSYQNLEIIIVSDGSKDGTLAIAQKLSHTDRRITVIDKPNSGVSDTRTQGIKNSHGAYLMFVDSDDYVDKDYVKYFYGLITYNGRNYDLAMDYNKYSIYTPNQVKTEKNTILEPNNVAAYIYTSRIHEAVWNKIYKRSFLESNRLSFNKDIWYGEGMLFNIECLQHTNLIPVGNRRVYHQCYNKDSAMRKFSMESNLCGLRSLDLQKQCWKNTDKTLLNAWKFHKNCFNMSILKGIIKTDSKSNYQKIYKDCIRNLRKGWYCPWLTSISLKRKVFFIISSIAPVTSAKLFILNERRKASAIAVKEALC